MSQAELAANEDALIAEYLNKMAEYQALAADAGQSWSTAYIELAHAKLNQDIGQHSYDFRTSRTRATVGAEFELLDDIDAKDPILMFGGWSVQALKAAQRAFWLALDSRVKCARIIKELDILEDELTRIRSKATNTEPPAQLDVNSGGN